MFPCVSSFSVLKLVEVELVFNHIINLGSPNSYVALKGHKINGRSWKMISKFHLFRLFAKLWLFSETY